MTGLPPRESACLCFIEAFTALEGRAPSYSEIARALSLPHKQSAVNTVTKLRRRNLLNRGGRRIPGSRVAGLQIVGPQDQSPLQAEARQ